MVQSVREELTTFEITFEKLILLKKSVLTGEGKGDTANVYVGGKN